MVRFASLLSEHQRLIDVAPRILIGYSGGMDSHLLLQAVVETFPHKPLCAIHVNHQLHPNSDQWEAHCRETANQLGVTFISDKVTIPGDSAIEEQARKARYTVFERHLQEDDILLTAHHADDQIETFLFRLLRGSGLKGLAGMPISRQLGQGHLLRPLLKFSRHELKKMAQQEKIEWVDDPSNTDTKYDRNYLRNELMPVIQERWGSADKQILALTEQFNEVDSLLSELADDDLENCDLRKESIGISLDIRRLLQLRQVRQDNLLRRFVFKYSNTQPNNQALEQIRSNIIEASVDSQPLLLLGNVEVRRFDGRLYLVPKLSDLELSSEFQSLWPAGQQTLRVSGMWEIQRLNHLDQDFRVELRKGGERAKPSHRQHSQTLKKLLLEHKVEPWLRDWLPIIYSGNEIVAVGDRIFCADIQFQMHWLIEQSD